MINVTFQIGREKIIFPLNDTSTIDYYYLLLLVLFIRKLSWSFISYHVKIDSR